MAGRTGLVIFLIFFYINGINNSKLNVPRILLPLFNDLSVNFTLEVTDGGCYTWSTSRLDLLQLTPKYVDEERGCSESVVVSTISKETVRNTAMILAQEIQTEQILRCDIIVDLIHSLKIVTTTRELYMEEPPEAFEVRAYDDQGNEFSSLEGIPFQWNLIVNCPNQGKCPDPVLRFMTFKESPYETPPSVQVFDELGLQGHIVLIEGVKTGISKVSVQLPQTEYRHLEAAEVSLMVVANIIILPPEIHILPYADTKFRVYRMQQNKLEEIEMPNKQYYFSIKDSNIAIAREDGNITGVEIGKTKIFINDLNVDPSDSTVKIPSALLVVVMPAYLTVNILPHKNWAIMLRDYHEIVVEAFCSQDHKIVLGDRVRVNVQIDQKIFQITDKSVNGTWLKGYGVNIGFSPVHASLESVNNRQLQPRVSTRSDLFVYPRITLIPTEIILPWDPVTRPKYEVRLKATGGDGNFLWGTTNAAIAVVTQGGIVRTQSQGNVDISAAMARNHHNRKATRVYILPPTRLEIVEYILEAETNKPIHLQIALYGNRSPKLKEEVPFTQCNEIPFKVTSSDPDFYYNATEKSQPVGTSCTTIAIIGKTVGISKITVSYEYEDNILEDSVTVSAYRPLTILNPKKGETVLAVGTSRNVIAQGGPRPWIGCPSEHNRKIISSDSTMVEVRDMTDYLLCDENQCGKDIYWIQVHCLKIGEATVDLSISNLPIVPTSCGNLMSNVLVKVVCGKPRIINIKPEINIVDTQSCPMDQSSQKLAVHNYQNIDIGITVQDDMGRVFDNISSLQFVWRLHPTNLGSILLLNGFKEETTNEYNVILPLRYIQTIQPSKQNGVLEVAVIVENYRRNMLAVQGINPNSINIYEGFDCPAGDCSRLQIPPLFTALTFVLVGDVAVSQKKIVIYNHPNNIQYIDLNQGSGFYEIALSSKDIASVKYIETTHELEITPKAIGELKINVKDVCLMSDPTPILIHVVSVKSIKVDMPDKVEIGKCIPAIVKVYDDSDELLPLPDLDLLELRSDVEINIINVKQSSEDGEPCTIPNDKWQTGEVHYVITGLELGETKISFLSGYGSREVRSTPINLQVFKPLRVLPRNITLIVGSLLQLTYEGGPSPDANIEFSVVNSKIATSEINGLVEAKEFGTTFVHAQAAGINSCTGQRVLYSKDTVQINVVKLTGIKISAPLVRFKVGKTIPVWVMGNPEQITPLILGTTKLPIKYKWQIIPEEIAKICTAFGCEKIKYSDQHKVAVLPTGLSPGRAKLILNVTVDRSITGELGTSETKFTSSLDIEVFEPLNVSPPVNFINQEIILAPHSSFQITSNKDRACHLTYLVQQGSTSIVAPGNEKSVGFTHPLISVTETGLVKSYGIVGRAVIIVTALEESGLKHTVTIVVEVKPVHYMLVQLETKINIANEEIINVIPRGANLELRITYHDNTGEEFTAVQNDIRIRVSRSDITKILQSSVNNTLIANLQKPGNTILKIWDDVSAMRVVNYIKFHVDDIIEPSSPKVTAGDIICFSAPLINDSGKLGFWNVVRPFLEMYDNNGVVIAAKPRDRPVSVSYVMSSKLQTSTDVHVLPIEKIRFLTENTCGCVSNSFKLSVEEIPLVLRSHYDKEDKRNNMISHRKCNIYPTNEIKDYPFTCEIEFTNPSISIDIDEIFAVEPHFNFKTGQYFCKIITLNSPELNTSLLDNNITLRARAGHVVEQVKLNFIPGIYIDTKELFITNNHYKAHVTIYGVEEVLENLEVSPVDDKILKVYSVKAPSDNTRKFEVILKDFQWKKHEADEKMRIEINSPMTKQRMKIDIKTEGVDSERFEGLHWGSPLLEALWSFRQTFAIGASIIGVFLVSLYGYSNYIQPIINVNIQSQKPLVMDYTTRGSPTGIAGPYTSYSSMTSTPTRQTGAVNCYGASPNITPPRKSSPNSSQLYNDISISPSRNRHLSYEELRNRALSK